MVFPQPLLADQGHDLLSGPWSLHFASNTYVEAFCHLLRFLNAGAAIARYEKMIVELFIVKDLKDGTTFNQGGGIGWLGQRNESFIGNSGDIEH